MRRAIGLASSAAARAALFVRGSSRARATWASHERRSFDAVSAVREALLLLGHALRKGNCRVRFEPPAPRLEIDGSPVRFGQVVTNSSWRTRPTRACPAAADHRGRARSAARRARAPRARRGHGDRSRDPPAHLRAHVHDQPFGQGTGLGLAIVHDVVTADFGGTIDVESRLGVGTTITIRFPRWRSVRMARKYRLASSSGYTIVLADDDPDYLEATRLLLESEGHEVLCATNGDESNT